MDRLNFRTKIVSRDELSAWRAALRSENKKLVVTNGCFDIIHLGHVTYLESARNLGDALLVGVNADAAVAQLKGDGRPVNSESDRASILAALESVTAVSLFVEPDATRFLTLAEPDIYVKGGDYDVGTINQDERRAVEKIGGKIVFIPFVAGKSTTGLLQKILKL